MVVPTYLKKKQNGDFSKYHRLQKQVSSKYVFIKNQVVSKFHGFNQNRAQNIYQSTLDFVTRYDVQYDIKEESEGKKTNELLVPLEIMPFTSYKMGNFHEQIDWRRGRIVGETISIVVKEGLIIEKVFLTPRGNLISAKRTELGFFLNFQTYIFNKIFQFSKFLR